MRAYDEMTKDELYEIAQGRDIEGRSEMDKDGLIAAIKKADAKRSGVRLFAMRAEDGSLEVRTIKFEDPDVALMAAAALADAAHAAHNEIAREAIEAEPMERARRQRGAEDTAPVAA